MSRLIDDARKARKAVEDDRKLRKQQSGLNPTAGTVPCPLCNIGDIMWSEMPNGHFHMECSLPGCISWAE